MGSNSDAGYEAGWVIDSAARAKTEHGHPFDRFDVFQVRSSEILVGTTTDEAWESISIIVKRDHPSQGFSQRRPNWREIDWIRNLFWEPWERVDIATLPQADGLQDHRILQMIRPADGWAQWPEMFREHQSGNVLEEVGATTVGEIAQVNREASASSKRQKQGDEIAKRFQEITQIIHSARIVERDIKDGGDSAQLTMVQFDRLKFLLNIE